MRWSIVFLLIWLQSPVLQAGVNIEDLLPPTSPIVDEAERDRIQQQIDADRARASQREQVERIAQQERERQWQAMQAQRPLGEQRVEQRCLTCHTPQLLAEQPRSLLQWGLVVQRMKWFNGADIPMAETYSIAQHLAETHPVTTVMRWLDSLFLVSFFIVFGLLSWRLHKKTKMKTKTKKIEDKYED